MPAGMGGSVVVAVLVVKVDGLFLCLCLPRAARPEDLLALSVVEVVLVVPPSFCSQVAYCPPAIPQDSSVGGALGGPVKSPGSAPPLVVGKLIVKVLLPSRCLHV